MAPKVAIYGTIPMQNIFFFKNGVIHEAERHRPAPHLWASFSRAAPRAAPRVANFKKYAIFHIEFKNYGPSPTHFH